MASFSGSELFGFINTTREDLQNVLDNDATVGGYWRKCMETLNASMDDTYARLRTKIRVIPEGSEGRIIPDDIPPITDGMIDSDLLLVNYTKFKNAVSGKLANVSWTSADIYLSPTQFYNKFFMELLHPSFFNKPNWRDLYEHRGASEQCSIAQKRLSVNPLVSWDICYICGDEIFDRYHIPPSEIHSSRQCEHVINAFTALGYKGLIQKSKLDVSGDPLLEQWFRYEYANAHACCNQVKSDDKWVTRSPDFLSYIIDTQQLQFTLKDIKSSDSYDCKSITALTIPTFVKDREEYITGTFLDPLLRIINQEAKTFGSLFEITIRIRQITALNLNIDEIVNAILTGQAPVMKNKDVINRAKAKTYCRNAFKSQSEKITFMQLFKDIWYLLPEDEVNELKRIIAGLPKRMTAPDNPIRVSQSIWADFISNPTVTFSIREIQSKALIYIQEVLYEDETSTKAIDEVQSITNYHLCLMKRFLIGIIRDWFSSNGIIAPVPSLERILTETQAKIEADILENSKYYKVTTGEDSMELIGGKKNKKKGGQLEIIDIIAKSERISSITADQYIEVNGLSIFDDSKDLQSLKDDIDAFAKMYSSYKPIKLQPKDTKVSKTPSSVKKITGPTIADARQIKRLTPKERELVSVFRPKQKSITEQLITGYGGNITQKRSKKNKRTSRRHRRTRNHKVI
jgi:hypothetical protein